MIGPASQSAPRPSAQCPGTASGIGQGSLGSDAFVFQTLAKIRD
jgi:hypothetical protein